MYGISSLFINEGKICETLGGIGVDEAHKPMLFSFILALSY